MRERGISILKAPVTKNKWRKIYIMNKNKMLYEFYLEKIWRKPGADPETGQPLIQQFLLLKGLK